VLGIQELGAFWHGDDRPRLDGPNQMALRWRQLPARRPPLTGRLERYGCAITFHQRDDETRRNVALGRRSAAGVTRRREGHNPTAKIQ
jgi:hypothetical protein